MNLRFYLFVSGVNQGNGGGGKDGGEGVSPMFHCVTPGFWDLSFSLIASEVAEFGTCGIFVDD